MTLSSGETPDPDQLLHAALVEFTYCIGSALEGICSWGLTIGDSYVPFNPDDGECEDPNDEDVSCSQAWVRVMGVTPVPTGDTGMSGDMCDIMLQADIEVGVLRCLDVAEGGEAPTAMEMLAASLQAMTDMTAVHRAAMACEVWGSIITNQWAPVGPLGAQYGGIWVFTVELPGDCLVSGNESG